MGIKCTKQNTIQHLPNDTSCTANGPQWAIKDDKNVTCDDMRTMIADGERWFQKGFINIARQATLLIVDDVALCWPYCDVE
jgi:hypothetical protein